MGKPTCPVCGGKTCRYGKTAAGSQRWICTSCKATSTHRIDNDAKLLREFLGWLLSGKRQQDLPGQGRYFRRKTEAPSGETLVAATNEAAGLWLPPEGPASSSLVPV